MSTMSFPPLSTTDATRCKTYWWVYGKMIWASFVAEDESEDKQVRREALAKQDECIRWIGHHLADCDECKRWFHSFKNSPLQGVAQLRTGSEATEKTT